MRKWLILSALFITGLSCFAQAQAPNVRAVIFPPPMPSAVTTTYVTGNRTASITVTASADQATPFVGTLPTLVNGVIATGASDACIPNAATVATGPTWFKFDFGSGKIVDEARWYQSGTTANGTFKWQGSNDNAAWTDIGTSFVLGGATLQTQTQLNGNTTSYRYYRLLGVSGNITSSDWLEEIEFRQN